MTRTLLILSLAAAAIAAGAKPASKAAPVEYTNFSMDSFFKCAVPKAWEQKRDQAAEGKTKIYEVELLGPRVENAPVMILVGYYAKDNKDFRDYKDFIERNSKDTIGRTETPTSKYSPVKESALNKKKAFSFERDVKEFLHPEGSSDEFVMVKEKFYVLPAKEGFHVLHYYAPQSAFSRHLAVFNKVASTFKGL
ncbi:MAG: hypothetical protein A3J79_08560 [Elusimicrobia bacterium RIFOXYB2_FULL_62_6]|nr:MAG: hypothetical protein A3J79_08560 [Elusimicrobia bacterium RIFOXYB2_FULL_62_6]